MKVKTKARELFRACLDLDCAVFQIELALEDLDPESEKAQRLEKIKDILNHQIKKIKKIREESK